MNPKSFTPEVLAATVVAVPPLARNANFTFCHAANLRIVRHLEAGGIRALLYGGNANFYHLAPSEYGQVLELLSGVAGDRTTVIPAVGPAFGVMMDQAATLRSFDFPTAMVLPQQGITTSDGVATGVRRFAEACGKPAVLYLKHEGYMQADDVRRLVDDGVVSIIKYAIVRNNPADDAELRRLVETIDPKRIMSGIGEQPAIIHLRDFGLGGFTSGCVCIAPRLSMNMRSAIESHDFTAAEAIRRQFQALEDLRNEISPIRVLHAAVALADIAETGPMTPLLSDVSEEQCKTIEAAAKELFAIDESTWSNEQSTNSCP